MEMGRLHFRPHGLRQIKTGRAIKWRRIRRRSTQSLRRTGKHEAPEQIKPSAELICVRFGAPPPRP